MPPKKQQKLDNTGLTDGLPKASKRGGKAAVSKDKKQSKKPPKRQKISTADKSVLEEAAEGAGVRSTDELREYMRETRAKARCAKKSDVSLEQGPSTSSGTKPADNSPESDSDGSLSSHNDSSSSESSDSDDDSQDSGSPNNPVRRKLPFNRETGDFVPAQVSPGSLENGKDVRDLGKLQDILMTNPQAVTAISSMLDVIKAMQSDNQPTQSQPNPSDLPRERVGNVMLPPPPPPNRADNRPGMSETTIYTQAVPSASPSQEQQRNLDLCLDRLVVSGNVTQSDQPVRDDHTNFDISPPDLPPFVNNINLDGPLGTSAVPPVDHHQDDLQQERQAAKNHTDQMVLEAERQKIAMERPVTGKKFVVNPDLLKILDDPGSHDLACDNNLYGLSIHLDDQTIALIEAGQFVDLSKLIPHDKVVPDDEPEKLQLVNQEGRLGVAPAVDKDAVIINCFKKCELAFDVYAGVFTRAHPRRGPEMLEYKHIIRRAADTYVWTNVYNYDKIHRTHMQRNPGQTWSKKHKDAWSDHVKIYKNAALMTGQELVNPGRKRKPCRFFNKNGKCNKGSNCEFDHKCAFCGMYGHGKHNCRKFLALKKEEGHPVPSKPSASTSTTSTVT